MPYHGKCVTLLHEPSRAQIGTQGTVGLFVNSNRIYVARIHAGPAQYCGPAPFSLPACLGRQQQPLAQQVQRGERDACSVLLMPEAVLRGGTGRGALAALRARPAQIKAHAGGQLPDGAAQLPALLCAQCTFRVMTVPRSKQYKPVTRREAWAFQAERGALSNLVSADTSW